MDNPFFKRHIKIDNTHGFGTVLDLDQDKPNEEDYETIMARKLEMEEQAKVIRNRHFDPLYMETDLPETPEQPGGISFDPNDMTFDF